MIQDVRPKLRWQVTLWRSTLTNGKRDYGRLLLKHVSVGGLDSIELPWRNVNLFTIQ